MTAPLQMNTTEKIHRCSEKGRVVVVWQKTMLQQMVCLAPPTGNSRKRMSESFTSLTCINTWIDACCISVCTIHRKTCFVKSQRQTCQNRGFAASPWRHIIAPEDSVVCRGGSDGGASLYAVASSSVRGNNKQRLMKASVCFGGGDLPSETDRLCLREIGNERRDSIGQLEEKLRVLQVKLS